MSRHYVAHSRALPIKGTTDVAVPERTISAAAARSADGAPDRAELRLDKRTHLDGRYRVTLRQFGPDLAEIGWSFIGNGPTPKARRGASALLLQNQDRSARRARSRLRHLVLATKADHLLTLTYRSNVTDFAAASADLAKFVRRIRQAIPGWHYIAVAERQKRGAWHWHLAVRGRQDVALLRRTWRNVVGDGNIDVSTSDHHSRVKALALVRYLGKYLAKGFDGEHRLNARRFRASHGIQVPMQHLEVPEEYRGDVAAFALIALGQATNSIGFVWQAADRTAGWASSWK